MQGLAAKPKASVASNREASKAITRNQPDWGKSKVLDVSDVLSFERKGFLLTRSLLQPSSIEQDLKHESADIIERGKLKALQHRVRVLCPKIKTVPKTEAEARNLIRQHGTDTVGFLQFFNSWTHSELIKSLVLSEVLASAAAQLLGVPRVRLYQDCLFYKEPGFSSTNWHSDLRMAPFDTNHFITAWIPLRPIRNEATPTHHTSEPSQHKQSTPQEKAKISSKPSKRQAVTSPEQLKDSGLLFAAGSHRDFALPFWHDLQGADLSTRGYEMCSTGNMEVGDVSFHHGWTIHCAGPQPKTSPPRLALAVSYFADGAKLLKRKDPSVHTHLLHNEDYDSFADWHKDMKDGAVASHARLPIAYPRATKA